MAEYQAELRVLSVANQKGGVGKTTTAINLGTALAAIGEKVMVMDMDPQGNASTGLGVPPGSRSMTSYSVLAGEASALQAAVPAAVPNLYVVPGNADLVGFETEYMTDRNRAFRLRDALTAMQGEQRARPTEAPFTYVLIDYPPSLNLLTVNALVASSAVIVPVQCEFFALEGISQLNDSIQQIRGSLNPDLRVISRAIETASIDKLKKAGADYVFSPEMIGGIHLAAAALRPTVMSFLDTILRGQKFNLLLDEILVKEDSVIAGKTLKEAEISKNIGIIIPAIRSKGTATLNFNPSSDSIINSGDTLIGFGTVEQLKQLRKLCS